MKHEGLLSQTNDSSVCVPFLMQCECTVFVSDIYSEGALQRLA